MTEITARIPECPATGDHLLATATTKERRIQLTYSASDGVYSVHARGGKNRPESSSWFPPMPESRRERAIEEFVYEMHKELERGV